MSAVIDEITAGSILRGEVFLADYDGSQPEHDILAIADKPLLAGPYAAVGWTAITPRRDGSLTTGCTRYGRGHMVTRVVMGGAA